MTGGLRAAREEPLPYSLARLANGVFNHAVDWIFGSVSPPRDCYITRYDQGGRPLYGRCTRNRIMKYNRGERRWMISKPIGGN